MNARERFRATCRFEPVDRPFRWEPVGFRPETIARWHDEGLPEKAEMITSFIHFGMDLRMLIVSYQMVLPDSLEVEELP